MLLFLLGCCAENGALCDTGDSNAVADDVFYPGEVITAIIPPENTWEVKFFWCEGEAGITLPIDLWNSERDCKSVSGSTNTHGTVSLTRHGTTFDFYRVSTGELCWSTKDVVTDPCPGFGVGGVATTVRHWR